MMIQDEIQDIKFPPRETFKETEESSRKMSSVTYRMLKDKLENMCESDLEKSVTVQYNDEVFGVIYTTDSDFEGVLDSPHLILVVNDD